MVINIVIMMLLQEVRLTIWVTTIVVVVVVEVIVLFIRVSFRYFGDHLLT